MLPINISADFVLVQKGQFQMGSTEGLPLETPIHTEVIQENFHVLKHPVTQSLYYAVTGHNPSHWKDSTCPVENINWHEARNFCVKLSSLLNRRVRLPLEKEWEYFCRAESKDEFFFGSDYRHLSEYAWFDLNSMDKTQPICQKKSNPWGLFDVIGNVWEWCEDRFSSDYHYSFISDQKRVIRGGAFDMDYFRLRSAYRSSEFESISSRKIGFRIIIE